jgi:serine/threonine-protein kinase
MTSSARERWRRVQAMCERLEAVPPSPRFERLRALEPDPDVQREAIALLQAIEDEARARREHLPSNTAADPAGLPTEIGGVRIEARLGTGGSGSVYRGVRRTHGPEQIVAVKQFHAHRADPRDLERFAREQRILATLTHPAIVRFFDAGWSADGRPYLVMELAEGWPIVQFADERRLGLHDRLALFLIVCDAVQSAHERQILHLDLKPSNVIVTHDGHVKLVDFGTAKLTDPALDLTRTEPLTVQYASPERLRGEPVSVACDVYSLGLILFELVSGGWPYARRESIVAIAERAAGTTPILPLAASITADAAARRHTTRTRLQRAVRGTLDAIVTMALAHEPAARYGSVDALASDLRGFLAGTPTRARPYSWRGRTARWLQHRRRPLAGSAAAIAIVAASVFLSRAGALKRPPARDSVGVDARTSMRAADAPSGGARIYDDFIPTENGRITAATWSGVYCMQAARSQAPAANAVAFLVGIYADAEGQPNLSAPLHHASYPIHRTSEVLERVGPAHCGGVRTTYAFYRYAVTLDEPVVTMASTRYWFSVQALVRQAHPESLPVFWGWQGRAEADGSLQILDNGTVVRFPYGRIFSVLRDD